MASLMIFLPTKILSIDFSVLSFWQMILEAIMFGQMCILIIIVVDMVQMRQISLRENKHRLKIVKQNVHHIRTSAIGQILGNADAIIIARMEAQRLPVIQTQSRRNPKWVCILKGSLSMHIFLMNYKTKTLRSNKCTDS